MMNVLAVCASKDEVTLSHKNTFECIFLQMWDIHTSCCSYCRNIQVDILKKRDNMVKRFLSSSSAKGRLFSD